MRTTTLTYPSHDGASQVRALVWRPRDGERPRGLVQIVHGMSEHVERYGRFASFLVGQGFWVCANDHVGHGATAPTEQDLGHIPLKAGEDILIEDVHSLRERVLTLMAEEGHPSSALDAAEEIPYVIFGHSMGSFVTRVYLTRHAWGVRAAIICGTGQQPRALTAAGSALTRVLAALRGERHRSGLVHALGTGAFSRAVRGAETPEDWIATDWDTVRAYREDPRCGQVFTVGGYATVSALAADAQRAKLTARIPKSLPMLFIAGAEDPVGDFGRGVDRAVGQYRAAGLERVDEIVYPGARHEILNEPIAGQVHADVLAWLGARGL